MSKLSNLEIALNHKNKYNTILIQVGGPFVLFVFMLLVITIASAYLILTTSDFEIRKSEVQTAVNISNYINRELSALNFNASNIAYITGLSDQSVAMEYSQKILDLRPQILKISFFDNSKKLLWDIKSLPGVALSGSDKLTLIPSQVLNEDYLDVDLNIYLHRAIYPVFNRDKIKTGAIELIFDTSFLWETLSSYNADNIYIINENGNIILSKKQIKSENTNLGTGLLEKYKDKLDIIIKSNENKKEIYGIAKRIDKTEWMLVQENQINLNSLSLTLIYKVSIIFIFILLAMLIIEIILFKKKIISPLNSLKKLSGNIADEDYNSLVLKNSNNEFDEIFTNLNKIVFNIKSIIDNANSKLLEKTNSLTQKVKDSELVGSFMINRELKMSELKKENKKLLEELKLLKDIKPSNSDIINKDL